MPLALMPPPVARITRGRVLPCHCSGQLAPIINTCEYASPVLSSPGTIRFPTLFKERAALTRNIDGSISRSSYGGRSVTRVLRQTIKLIHDNAVRACITEVLCAHKNAARLLK